jgi:hypothetical protein
MTSVIRRVTVQALTKPKHWPEYPVNDALKTCPWAESIIPQSLKLKQSSRLLIAVMVFPVSQNAPVLPATIFTPVFSSSILSKYRKAIYYLDKFSESGWSQVDSMAIARSIST